ncbi:MAG: hypothetical protein EXR58_06160 [Chloroflexi bacterium]|nr:hypothetical protein [Chloroflexota bacterium]
MVVIDSDAHVIETETVWDYLEPSEQRFRPVWREGRDGTLRGAGWLIDGQISSTGAGSVAATQEQLEEQSRRTGRELVTPAGAKELVDVPARLRHMDELGVDIQVCHSTLWIRAVANEPATDVALCRAWNRWMYDGYARSNGRLQWSCVLPFLSMPDTLDELKWAKEHGACAVFMRPVEGERLLHDPYFYPLYEAVSAANIAIAVHIGNSNREMVRLLSQRNGGAAFWTLRLANAGACHALLMSEVLDVFPTLRFGFLESGAGWVPHALIDLRSRLRRQGKETPANLLEQKRVYVACQSDDDVPYVLKWTGEHNLVSGTDYGHTDQSSELATFRLLKEECDISQDQWRRIAGDNPKALYALDVN